MKKIICIVLSALFALSVAGCGGDGGKKPIDEVTVDSAYERYDVTAALDTLTEGYGAQIDTDVYMPWNKLTTEEEAMLEQRIKDMNLQFTRIKFFPEFFERANDNDDPDVFDYDAAGVDFDCVEMQALYKILDICEKYHINVDLSWYGCYCWFTSYDKKYDGTWMGYTKSEIANAWVTAPKRTYIGTEVDFDGYAEYAENISVMLDYLMNTKHYTCLWGFSVIPEMFMNADGIISWDEYAVCLGVIDAKLRKDGMRDKLKFIGSSNAGNVPKNFKVEQEKTKQYYDILGTGNYNWDNDAPMESAENYFTEMIGISKEFGKKGWYVAEFCQGKHFINAVDKEDIDWYTAGLYVARFTTAATSVGVTAFNHYILGDTWFTNSYVHTMGLWMYRNNNWKAHPEYYFYGLICKYSDIGSEVHPIVQADKDNPQYDINMVALKLPDGSWTYFICNNSNETKKVGVVNLGADRPDLMKAYKVTEASIPQDRAVVLPSSYVDVKTDGGIAYVSLPAKSFTVLSDKK